MKGQEYVILQNGIDNANWVLHIRKMFFLIVLSFIIIMVNTYIRGKYVNTPQLIIVGIFGWLT